MFRDRLAARLAEMGTSPDYPRLVLEVLGIRGASPELARRLVAQALVVEDRHDTWRRVGERVCRRAPDRPGVYLFRDGQGQALYVGKAINLRRRLGAHFTDRRWLAMKPAFARVASVEWEEVGSEIEGLMREATLIRERQPLVNIQIGTPVLRRRVVPRALLRDVVVLVPTVDPDAVALIAAATDGRSMVQRTRRSGADLRAHGEQAWQFFRVPSGRASNPADGSHAALVFSWLAGRGADATRLDPHDARSAADLRARLRALLKDKQLFTERLVLSAASSTNTQ